MTHTETTEAVERLVEDVMHDAESYVADYSNKEWFSNRVRTALTTIRKETLEEARQAVEAAEAYKAKLLADNAQ